MIIVHFIDVGQGNMTAVLFPDNFVIVYDCNITNENEESVFAYLGRIMPKNNIDLFVNSHRDADHMRGIKKLNAKYPIGTIWDSGVSGNTGTTEYQEYMELRRNKHSIVVEPGQCLQNKPYVKILNGKRDLDDPNSQSIVLQIDHDGSSVLLTGDTNVSVWREYIMYESINQIKSLVLLASHHGSFTFFNENRDQDYDYTQHLKKISPAITIISVGSNNQHGHPDNDAIKYYESHSYGTVDEKLKIFRTDIHKNMKLELKGNGTGTIYWFH